MTTGESYPFEALYRISRVLHQKTLDTAQVIQAALVHIGELIDVRQGCLITFHADATIQTAYILNAGGASAEESMVLWETLLDRGLVGFVYHAQRTVVIHNIQTDPRWPVDLPDSPAIPTAGSVIGLPLARDESVFGVMLFMHETVNFFNKARTTLLEEVAGLTSEAVSNALHYDADKYSVASYDALFHQAIVPILLTDLNGQIIDLNTAAEETLGYRHDEVLHRPITLINSIDSSPWESEGLSSLHPDEPVSFRTVAITSSGERKAVILRVRRIQHAGDACVEWLQQDITVQAELDQLRDDLSSMIYHDMRGPLSTIRGSIHKLAQVLANHPNPAVLTFLQVGIRSTRQLRRMIDSLLDIQRLEEGNTILNRNPIELRVILADAVQLVQPLAIDAEQTLRFEWDNNLPMLDIDSDMILRVITNLLENAIKHTPEGGTIVLGVRPLGTDKMAISVRDSGNGIPKEYRTQIFDKFSRVKYKNAPQGLGLGLAFCRLAVDAHGGDIWVESEPGEGSEFIFTLPVNLPSADGSSANGTVTTAITA